MSDGASWSLRESLARQFAIVATVFLIVAGVAVTLTYRIVLANELDEELIEQLDEVTGRFEGGADQFERLVTPLALAEAETPTAWRAVVLESGEVWGPHGTPELAVWFDEPAGEGVTRPTTVLRRTRRELAPGIEVDVVLDGTDWIERVTGFALVMLVVVITGAALSLLAGRVFGTRVARLLASVATEIEAADQRGGEAVEVPGAPTEIRRVVEALETTLAATRTEMERSRVLSAGLAHDLRAPVQALLTSTQVALIEQDADSDTGEMLRGHLGELRELARTIDNLVAWGSPRQGDTEFERLPDLGRELESRLQTEEEEAARRGVFLDLEREGDLGLLCDPRALVLAVRNLIGNALAWSPEGGQVRVRCEGHTDAIRILVEDEGPGVPASEREKIFEAFVRGAAAPGRRAGYGLGLAIVAYVAERHGGTIACEEAPSGGALFKLCLPRAAVSSEPRA